MVTPRPFNAPVGFNPTVSSVTQTSRDAAVAAERIRQMQAARNAANTARGVTTTGRGLNLLRAGTSLTPQGLLGNLAVFALPPAAEATGRFLRSPQGILLKDRLRQGDVSGFVQGLFSPRAAKANPLQQYNPSGYDPSKAVTSADLLQSVRGITSADIGGDGSSDEARALASQYAPKPFPMTPEGQFERYFKTPEMDQYFGAASRGEGAPKDVAGMEALAGQLTAPQDVPLSAYYRAQSATGRANMPEITQELGYAKGSALAEWATKNPMLAQRLYAKKQAGGAASLAPDEQTVMGDLGSRTQAENPYKDTPEAFGMPANPVPPTQQPGPGGMDQGTRVSFFRGAENITPLQLEKTTGRGMPAFPTIGAKTEEFLKRPGIAPLF